MKRQEKMVMNIKHYLVDSENVNDNWLMLLDMAEETDEIIVFYTKNSPHMSYPSVVRLLQTERQVKFEECHEGNNALDFQLVSYLGYLICSDQSEDSEFIIMSNDTGFDAAVSFWKERYFQVNRINVNYCKLFLSKKKKKEVRVTEEETLLPAPAQVCDPPLIQPEEIITKTEDQLPPEEVPQNADNLQPVKMIVSPETEEEKNFNFNRNEVDLFINCLGRDNLVDIHETLVHVYGQQQGQNIYKTVKAKSYPLIEKQYKRKEKVENYTRMIFYHSSLNVPDNFVDFLEDNKDKTKNLNGIRSAIVKVYGDDAGMKYYSLFKPYFKIISALK